MVSFRCRVRAAKYPHCLRACIDDLDCLRIPRLLLHPRATASIATIRGPARAGPAVLLLCVLEDGPVKHVVPREACRPEWKGGRSDAVDVTCAAQKSIARQRLAACSTPRPRAHPRARTGRGRACAGTHSRACRQTAVTARTAGREGRVSRWVS